VRKYRFHFIAKAAELWFFQANWKSVLAIQNENIAKGAQTLLAMLPGSPQSGSLLPEIIGFGEAQGARSYECLVKGKLESGVFLRLLTLLESTGVKIQSSSYEAIQKEHSFSATVLLQTAKSDADMFALVEKIMRSQIVESIEFSPRNKRIFSNYRFPIHLGKNERSVLLRADIIFDLESGFRNVLGEKSGLLFYEAGKSYGRDLAHLCPKKSEFESVIEYLDAVLDATKATGWGVSKCEQLTDSEFLFSMSEPPPKISTTKSDFLIGMLIGIAETVFGRKLKVGESNFDISKAVYSLKFLSSFEK